MSASDAPAAAGAPPRAPAVAVPRGAAPRAVAEPDLSMEVQVQLKQKLAELQPQLPADEATTQDFAERAARSMINTLKSFYPEMSPERLSVAVHGIIHSEAVVGKLSADSKAALRQMVPEDRSKWLAPDVERHLTARSALLRRLAERVGRAWLATRARATAVASDPKVQAVAMGSGGGAALLAAAGGSMGLAGGVAAGAAVGAVPALLTFGLSIPVGAAIGGGAGATLGATTGAVAGLVGGGTASGVAYAYRAEIMDGADLVKAKAAETATYAKETVATVVEKVKQTTETTVTTVRTQVDSATTTAFEAVKTTATKAKDTMVQVADYTKTKATEVGAGAVEIARDARVQATAASAAGGAVAAGAAAGTAGMVTGGVLGAAVGLVPAFFTFGLSIPVGAAIGGGAGLVIGATTGGAAGAIGGGAAGYGVYTKRNEIRDGATGAWEKVHSIAESVREKATKLVGGTGGTA